MANMSYCRFHNTRMDMNDCIEALRRIEDGDEDISKEEAKYCIWMFDSITDYLYDEGLLEDFDYDAYEEWKDNVKEWSKR